MGFARGPVWIGAGVCRFGVYTLLCPLEMYVMDATRRGWPLERIEPPSAMSESEPSQDRHNPGEADVQTGKTGLGERVRDWASRLGDWVESLLPAPAPAPVLVPIPVRNRRRR